MGLAQVRLALAPVRPAQVRLALGLAQVRLAQVGLGVVLEVLPDHPQEVGPVAVIPQWISQVECRRRECPGIESDSRRDAGESKLRPGAARHPVAFRFCGWNCGPDYAIAIILNPGNRIGALHCGRDVRPPPECASMS